MDFMAIISTAPQPQDNAVNAHSSHMTLDSVCTSGVLTVFTSLLGSMSGSHTPVTAVTSHAAALTFGPAALV